MINEYNVSSYYRANPFYQQGYLPDSAFKNRKPNNFMVQLPQGNDFFEPIGKKHYQNLSYKSNLAEDHMILHEKGQNSHQFPAKNKEYFRSLNTVDIEGASTNTLISQAVKNRIKAQQELNRRQKSRQDEELKHKLLSYQKHEDQQKRLQAIAKMRTKQNGQAANYHDIQKRLRTDQSKQAISPQRNDQRGRNLYNQNGLKNTNGNRNGQEETNEQERKRQYEAAYKQYYGRDLNKLESDTYLEKQLLMRQKQKRAKLSQYGSQGLNLHNPVYQIKPNNMGHSASNDADERQGLQHQKAANFHQNQRQINQQTLKRQPQYFQQMQHQKPYMKPPQKHFDYSKIQNSQDQQTRLLAQNLNRSYLRKDSQDNNHYSSQHYDPINNQQSRQDRNQVNSPIQQVRKQRSLTLNNPNLVQNSLKDGQPNYSNNPPPPRIADEDPQERSYQEAKIVSSYQSRQQHRRFNPTFLSFGSPAVGYANRNA